MGVEMMNKKIVVFGCFLAVFLMMLVPNISAIESRSITEDITDYNENELINAIKVRIEQLKVQNPNPKMSLKLESSDSPFEGGLDDRSDWRDLFFGLGYGIALALFFKYQMLQRAFVTGYPYEIAIWIIDYGLYTWVTLTHLGDAFDIIDPNKDGY